MKQAYDLFHAGVLAFARAEQQGIRVDMEVLKRQKRQLTKDIEILEEQFMSSKFYRHWVNWSKGKININSNSQLGTFLFKGKKITPLKFTEKGTASTDEDALTQLNIPELDMLIKMRKLKKLRDTYLSSYEREQVDGYIHPFYNLHTVTTYRSSSNSPNFQNVPKRDKEAMRIIRSTLFPRPGHQLMEVDFSGIEVSIAACYHKDPTMIEYLTTDGKDMHGDMAAQIFKISKFDKSLPEHGLLRSATKNSFVFPQFYGDYYKNNALGLCEWCKLPHTKFKPNTGVMVSPDKHISDHLIENGICSFDDFVEHLKKIEKHFWTKRFPVYTKWKERWMEDYVSNGYFINYTGFRFTTEMGKNEVINYPVQSAAFHCLLWCFIEIDKIITKRGLQSRLIGQIHDAMVFDIVPEELSIMSKIIKKVTTKTLQESWNWINIPLKVEADLAEVDDSWANMEPFKI